MDFCLIASVPPDPTLWEQTLSWVWVIFSVAGGLGFVVFVHELGHFLVAKACGVKCEKFYVGFDWFPIKKIGPITIPRTICKFQWGETEYGVGILPLGGYVKMLGQDDDPFAAEAEAERTKVLKEGTAAEGLTPAATVEKKPKFTLDPRSYPAKSVPARMAIISAGVIMNLIFGVLLAALAYAIGVPETPAIIGGTVPGSPAWSKLQPGMKAIQFGDSTPYEFYRFEDIKQKVIFTGADGDLVVAFRDRNGEVKKYSLRPSARTVKETDFPSLGFYGPPSRKLVVSKDAPPPVAEIEHGDVVTAINGIELEKDPAKFDLRVNALRARNPKGPLQLTIERAEKDARGKPIKDAPKHVVQVEVPERGIRIIGAIMEIGPVVAVREGSPAEKAGIQIGDILEKVNGEPVGDPLSLGQRLIPKSSEGESYIFVVSRKDASGKNISKELKMQAELPDQFQEAFPYGGPTSVESIGIAFSVTNHIAAIEAGTPAAEKGLRPGDEVTGVRLIAEGKEGLEKENKKGFPDETFEDGIALDDDLRSWTRIHFYLQELEPDTQLELTLKRNTKEEKVVLSPISSKTFFAEDRGLRFSWMSVEHKASGTGEAFSLGFREVKERLGDVVTTLSKLVQGGIHPKHMSGPIGIISVAGTIASSGLPRLLLFLAFLSANLAIINFLPIPVLDGGHMLFLAAEGVRRKPVPPHIQGWLSIGGLAFLLALMLFATANDLQRWWQ